METSEEPNLSAQSVDAEEEVIIDPLTLMPDLFNAAVSNNTEQVLKFLEMKGPPTHLDHRTGFTVSRDLFSFAIITHSNASPIRHFIGHH